MLRYLFILFIISGSSFAASSITILLDAGHGGKDPGHLPIDDALLQEKHITLAISNKIGFYLTNNLQNVNVLYTRTDDTYPTLDERVEMANNNNVDYVLSIHVNGSDNTAIHGTETHIHNHSAKTSSSWAKLIEDQFKSRAGRKSRGVKTCDDLGHSIQLLKYTKMPTVLVECGFITNPTEAQYLNTSEGQDIIASAIFRATRGMLQKCHPEINFVREQIQQPVIAQNTYKVQIMSSVDSLSSTIPQFKKLAYPVECVLTNTTSNYKYRYFLGPFVDRTAANEAQKNAQSNGFPDAFIVVISNN